MKKYIPSEIEAKWQKKWEADQLYKVDLSRSKEKKYYLVEFTYPSGDLHMGHWFTFAIPDILARAKRMQGYNVFLPNGFDAFGLPAENAAIKRGIHPQDWTLSNIKKMKEQFGTMGGSYDWENEVITCLPNYYKWNQWLFIKMLEKGLAYKGKTLANWCSNCQTVLANENVEAGLCWRCGSEVIQKEVEQWFLKITDYVERLIWKDKPEDPRQGTTFSEANWPKSLREGQNNWIGKSIGVVINFDDIKIFTTRQDTIFGTTFIVISPEHPLLNQFVVPEKKKEVEKYLALVKDKTELQRKEEKEKIGVFTGSFVKNPMNNQQVPVWTADYVLMNYGTGAVMGVPAHDLRDYEFAKKYKLGIPSVISEEGILINSGEYNGITTQEAREKISDYLESHHLGKRQTNYHLHDWSISRQRYWGTPIPIIYCDNCGIVPVPEKDLPVEIPYEVDYAPKGKPPLATAEEWVNVKCPKCGQDAKREVETMDTFVDSSWYFFRYLDSKNEKEIFDPKKVVDWMPVDIYFGGSEHTLGHALYSRFFTKFIHDLGLISFDEYAKKRVHHGIILGPDGSRMSKSKGNVVNPDDQVKEYGADAVRLYLAFMGPYDIVASWNASGINGVYHFLQRVWGLQEKLLAISHQLSDEDQRLMHKTIKKVTEDLENIKFNTSIAMLMEWLNYLSAKGKVQSEEYKTFLLLLAPFAPHITEELWQEIGEKYSIHQESWPKFDEKYLIEEQVKVIIQINGKLRDTIKIEKDMVRDNKIVENKARESEKVKKYLEGKVVVKTIYIPGKIINFVVV